ncbi:hypothetical protein JCM8097_006166 [Rhodosporidiobolus ruineniae]
MVVAYRCHTYLEWRTDFDKSDLSFKEYNEKVYEPWLKRAYTIPKPYYLQPSHLFNKFDSEYARAHNEQAKFILKKHVEFISDFYRSPAFREFCLAWRFFTKEKREELCLLVWERQLRRAAEVEMGYRRDEAPEFTLAWAADPLNFEDLVAAQVLSPGSTVDYRIVPNKEWSALNEPPPSLPLSRGLRAYVDEGFVDRHLFLAQFTLQLIRAAAGLPDEERHMAACGVEPTAEDVAEARRSQTCSDGPILVGSESVGKIEKSIKHCSHCWCPETQKKLTVCGKCKEKQNRLVSFCGRDCQVAAWPEHKLTCGKPLANASVSVPSSRPSAPTPRRIEYLEWLRTRPTVVWALTTGGAGEQPWQLVDEKTYSFQLPPFIPRYIPTLDQLIATRDQAFISQDEVSLGILGLFLKAASPYSNPVASDVEKQLECLAVVLEIEDADLERAMVVADEAVSENEEWRLVKEALQILKSNDTSNRRSPILPRLEFFHNMRLARPDSFSSFPSPLDPKERYSALLPSLVKPFERSLRAIRAVASRAVESGGRDELAIGILALLSTTSLGKSGKKDPAREAFFETHLVASLASDFDLSKDKIVQLRERAREELEDAEGEEMELVKGVLVQLEKANEDRSRG